MARQLSKVVPGGKGVPVAGAAIKTVEFNFKTGAGSLHYANGKTKEFQVEDYKRK